MAEEGQGLYESQVIYTERTDAERQAHLLEYGKRFVSNARARRRRMERQAEDVQALNIEEEVSRLSSSLLCVNCDRETYDGGLYCTELCREFAKAVRYVRSVIRDGRIKQPDVKAAVGTKLLFLISGVAYPRKDRQLSEEQRQVIFDRDKNTCQLCGEPATQIDHISGSSNDLSNLRALCAQCNRNEMLRNARAITIFDDEWGQAQEIEQSVARRIASPLPIRFCDDDQLWDKSWRKIQSSRRSLMARGSGSSGTR